MSSNLGNKHSALITIWHNATTLKDEISEGQRLVILNLSGGTQNYQETGTICLSATRQTIFIFNKKLKSAVTSSCNYQPRCVIIFFKV